MNVLAPLPGRRSAAKTATSDHGAALLLAAVGDRNLLFSEERQAIYALSDLAAYVWRSQDAGLAASDIVDELIATGVAPDQAESAVMLAAQDLQTLLGAPAPALPAPSPKPSERLTRVTIRIAGVGVQLHLSAALVGNVETVFADLITDTPDTDMLLCARLDGTTVHASSPGQPDWSCEREQFVPLLKAQIIDAILLCAPYEVALHAAALVRQDDVVLLLGSPGAGKTTLAIALAKAGLGVLADDVVLVGRDGLVTGVHFPFTAKASSWPLLSRHWPGIVSHPSHCRPDGQTLCYIPQPPVTDPRPRRIGLVVILNRQDQVETLGEELDLSCALTAFVTDGATRDQRLSATAFQALAGSLRGARCCRLTYSDLLEAAAAVRAYPQ